MCISCLWSNRLSKQSLLLLVSFMRSCYRKCNWTKPVPLMMSVGDFTLEQTGPNFDLVFNPQFAYLCHFADWCACDHVCGCPHLTCGAERGHEVAVPPEYSQSARQWFPLSSSHGGHSCLGGPQQGPSPSPALSHEASDSPHLPAWVTSGLLARGWATQPASCSCGTLPSWQQ